MPDPVHIAILSLGFAVVAFVITIAQRLGEWRSKAAARVLGAMAALLVASWFYLAVLWVVKVDLRVLFAAQSPIFWIIAGTLSLMGLVAARGNWFSRNELIRAPESTSAAAGSTSAAKDWRVGQAGVKKLRVSGRRVLGDRPIVNVSPDDLLKFFKDHVHVQAKKLLEAYIGQWMVIDGAEVRDVFELPTGKVLITLNDANACLTFNEDWKQRVSVLKKGSRIAAVGQINGVISAGTTVDLEPCELLDS
jgi:hypothetical protein